MGKKEEFEHTGRVLRDEIRVAAPPEDVYRAWADPDTVTGWFVGAMDGRMEPGEVVTWRWDQEGPGMTQRVVIAEPPHRLVTAMELPQGVSYLEVTIEQDEGHSVIRLVQSGFGEGPEWDDQCEAMLSGWMMALGVLKLFAERYFGRQRKEVLVLMDASFQDDQVLELQRSESGLARWLTSSGAPGGDVGDPVKLVLANGKTLTGTVLRNTPRETLWSWDEIEGVVELKAFREANWGTQVGVRISSWMEDLRDLEELATWLRSAVAKLAEALA